MGFKIGGSLGQVEDVAIAENNVGWGKFLRVRVAINLFQSLDRGRSLRLYGSSCWVPFKFEKLSIFCYKCGRIIHEQRGCLVLVSNKQNEKTAWGLWLRAEELSRSPRAPENSRLS